MDQTIRTPPVGKRGLQSVAVAGKRLCHNIIELNFTKGAARLFV